ncbi:MAG: hypothetical protein AVDCRST_MAG51-1470, partial [uncultured Ramlibacter sp.]
DCRPARLSDCAPLQRRLVERPRACEVVCAVHRRSATAEDRRDGGEPLVLDRHRAGAAVLPGDARRREDFGGPSHPARDGQGDRPALAPAGRLRLLRHCRLLRRHLRGRGCIPHPPPQDAQTVG